LSLIKPGPKRGKLLKRDIDLDENCTIKFGKLENLFSRVFKPLSTKSRNFVFFPLEE
jgi:hypothetical protein